MLAGSSVPGVLASAHLVAGIPVVVEEGHHIAAVVRIGPGEDPDREEDPEMPLLGKLDTLEHLRRAK